MKATITKAAWLTRILCAVGLVMFAFAHRPPQLLAAMIETASLQLPDGSYPWLWTAEHDAVSREGAENSARGGRAPRDQALPRQLTAAFAFKLYDEQGFPLDLTELMARERGLKVDTAGFETLMEAQRARARAAQKKEVITLSENFAFSLSQHNLLVTVRSILLVMLLEFANIGFPTEVCLING